MFEFFWEISNFLCYMLFNYLSDFETICLSNAPLRSKNRFRAFASSSSAFHVFVIELISAAISALKSLQMYWKFPQKISDSLARVRAINRFSFVLNSLNPSFGFKATISITSFSWPWNDSYPLTSMPANRGSDLELECILILVFFQWFLIKRLKKNGF